MMKAFKTWGQAPIESRPSGIPLECPWQIVDCDESQEDHYESLGYQVLSDIDYEAYLESIEDEMSSWQLLIANKPRILKYLIDKNRVIDVREIDHTSQLDIALNAIEVLGQTSTNRGLLLEKQYYDNDNELIFKIEYTYQKNEYGQYTHQGLKLTWYNEDETIAAEKDKGLETLTSKRSKDIVKNRRRSVVDMLENNVEALLLGSGAGNEGLALGRALLAELSPQIQTFIDSGVSQGIIDFVSDPAKQAIYPFLLAEVAPGVSVVAYIIDFMNFT